MIIEINPEQRAALLLRPKDAAVSSSAVLDAFGGPAAIAAIKDTFETDGYVHVRGLLNPDLLSGLEDAAQAVVDESRSRPGLSFRTMQFGPVFASPPRPSSRADETNDLGGSRDDDGDATEARRSYFRDAALSSAVPRFVAAVLLGLPLTSDESLRVLKDAFLAKSVEDGTHCGWHVDDFGFWPCRAVDPSPGGVNAWMALDDIPAAAGGGMAVSPGSHVAEWRHEAYRIIGSTQTFPKEGYRTVEELMERARPQTCNMIEEGEEMNAIIEATKILPNYEKGDVLLCKRWLFHRSVPVNAVGERLMREKGTIACEGEGPENNCTAPTFKRYTVRYELGSSQLFEGVSLEAPVLLNPDNAGRTLDEVCAKEGPFYPQCWPTVDAREIEGMKKLVEEKLPAADKMRQKMFAPQTPKENRQSTSA